MLGRTFGDGPRFSGCVRPGEEEVMRHPGQRPTGPERLRDRHVELTAVIERDRAGDGLSDQVVSKCDALPLADRHAATDHRLQRRGHLIAWPIDHLREQPEAHRVIAEREGLEKATLGAVHVADGELDGGLDGAW